MLSEILKQVQLERTPGKWTFTLEPGQGQTYRSNKPTLYAHNIYPRHSVLAGQPLRRFITQWDSWDEARVELAKVNVKYDDFGEKGGTSHIDIDTLTAGLPEDDE